MDQDPEMNKNENTIDDGQEYGPIKQSIESAMQNYYADPEYDISKKIIRMISPDSVRGSKDSAAIVKNDQMSEIVRDQNTQSKLSKNDNPVVSPEEQQKIDGMQQDILSQLEQSKLGPAQNPSSNAEVSLQNMMSGIGSGLGTHEEIKASISKENITSANDLQTDMSTFDGRQQQELDKLKGNINIQSYLMNKPQVSQTSAEQNQIQQPPMSAPLNLDVEEGESPQELTKKAIFQLLRKFKLQQYANQMCQYGYSSDIYKLTFLSHREREELMDNLNMLPGHRERMFDLFRLSEQLNPKNTIKQTLLNAVKVQNKEQNRKSQQDESFPKFINIDKLELEEAAGTSGIITLSKRPNYSKPQTEQKKYNAGKQGELQKIYEARQNNLVGGTSSANSDLRQSSLDRAEQLRRKHILAEQKQLQRQSTQDAVRSLSRGQRSTGIPQTTGSKNRNNSNSLQRIYSQLDFKSKVAINNAFLLNIKSGRNHQTFHQALNQYANSEKEKKKAKKAIDQIFPQTKYFDKKVKEQLKSGRNELIKSYLKQTKSSSKKRAPVSRGPSNDKRKSLKRAPSQEKNILIDESKIIGQSSVSSNPRAGMSTLSKGHRPPLGGAATATTQKSQRKNARGLPPFIQTNIMNASSTAYGQRKNSRSGASATKESFSTRNRSGERLAPGFANPGGSSTSYKGGPKFITSSNQLKTVSKIFRDKSENNRTDGDPSSNHNSIQYVGNHYEKYETPDKNSKTSATKNLAVAAANRQRMRSQCQSQNKMQSAESQSSLLPQGAKIRKTMGQKKDSGIHDYASRQKNFFSQRNQSAKGPRPPLNAGKKDNARQSQNDGNFRHLLSNRQMAQQGIITLAKRPSVTRKSGLPAVKSSTQKADSLEENADVHIVVNKTTDEANQGVQLSQYVEDYAQLNQTADHVVLGKDVKMGRNAAELTDTTLHKSSEQDITTNSQSKPSNQQSQQNVTASKNGPPEIQTDFKNEQAPAQHTPNYSTPTDLKVSQQVTQEKQSVAETQQPEEQETTPEEVKESLGPAFNDHSQPLVDPEEHQDVWRHGYSFNSKKMAMAPVFFNVRMICDCVGRAIRRHIEFSHRDCLDHPDEESKEPYWFLDQMKEAKQEAKKQKKEEAKDLGKQDENIEESGDMSAFSYKFKDELKITTTKKDEANGQQQEEEDFDRNEDDDDIENLDVAINEVVEIKQIEEIRRDELKAKEVKEKSYVQMQLIEKDKKIKELTKMVKLYESGKLQGQPKEIQEVMVINPKSPDGLKDEDIEKKYDHDIYKMSRADFLMSQIDLDPIESNYSQEQKQLSQVNRQVKPGIGANNRLSSAVGSEQPAGDQIQENIVRSTNGNIQVTENQTMIDNSFNSLSQGKSLNGSGNQIPKMINSGGRSANRTDMMDNLNDLNLESQPSETSGPRLKMKPVQVSNPSTEKRPVKPVLQAKDATDGFSRVLQLQVLTDELQFFDERMEYPDSTSKNQKTYFNRDMGIITPSAEDIAAYAKYVTIASKMENEAPVIALVYIERILTKTGVLINKYNWKRVLLVCLCVASKVWDDDSLENVHFPKVMSDVTLPMINRLEQVLLDTLLDYDLVVKGSEYAKYYFIIRTLADEMRDQALTEDEIHRKMQNQRRKRRKGNSADEWAEYPLNKPISADQMLLLQRNSAKAELFLKERYQKEVILALGDKFKGDEQKIRQRKFLGEKLENREEYVKGMLSATM